MTTRALSPHQRDQAALGRELDRVYTALHGSSARAVSPKASRGTTLDHVGERFGLSAFERDLLLLCAGCELEARFAEACATANHNPRAIWPTFGLAFSALAGAHWSAVGSEAPLRYWRMIEISPGASLMRSPLRASERMLCFLIGVACLDERLHGLVRKLEPSGPTTSEPYAACAARAVEYWASAGGGSRPVLLVGKRPADQLLVAEGIGRALGAPCFTMRAADVPPEAGERARIARLWTREAMLTGAALFIQAGHTSEAEPQEASRLMAFLDAARGPIAVGVREGSELEPMAGFRIPVPALTTGERRAAWVESLGAPTSQSNGNLDRLADYFDLDAAAIRLAGGVVRSAAARRPKSDLGKLAWRECRVQARRSFEGLATRVPPRAGWDDLILPEPQKDILRRIVAQVHQRSVVHGAWGFAERYSRGLGLTTLFAGASGTGKTMAAEVVAGALDLDLFQIDLSGVVSKYIGETEKNLRRIFDAAESSGAVLLFDEADALFGKRSEVKDSHDRYANFEISYLLQRMDSYRGLAILTSNMKQALDAAFLRRFRFILNFPFPGPAERRGIWQRVFPARTPLGALDFARISQLDIAGGVIRNIAMHAAFLAADQGSTVGMEHILSAAKVEYAKLDRPLTPSEIGGWS